MDRFTQNDPERQANIAFALIFLGIIAVGALTIWLFTEPPRQALPGGQASPYPPDRARNALPAPFQDRAACLPGSTIVDIPA